MGAGREGYPVPVVVNRMSLHRAPWKRFVAIACLTLLALLRAESTVNGMQGREPVPARIFRLAEASEGMQVHLLGWQWRLRLNDYPGLAEAPSRIREGVGELIDQVRRWGELFPTP